MQLCSRERLVYDVSCSGEIAPRQLSVLKGEQGRVSQLCSKVGRCCVFRRVLPGSAVLPLPFLSCFILENSFSDTAYCGRRDCTVDIGTGCGQACERGGVRVPPAIRIFSCKRIPNRVRCLPRFPFNWFLGLFLPD